MPLAYWAFDTRQKLLLENIAPLVTSLTDEGVSTNNFVPLSNLLNYLPRTETDGLLRHRDENDKKRALVERLMIYAFFTAHHRCGWKELVFDCSEITRPVLISPARLKNVSFNISHCDDWVILVGETELSPDSPVRLGIDVMDFQEVFFKARARGQFTPKEMLFIPEVSTTDTSQGGGGGNITEAKLKRLFRLWCLKESIIRVLDISNDHFDHRSIECIIQSEEKTGKPMKDVIEIRRFDWKELLKDADSYLVSTR